MIKFPTLKKKKQFVISKPKLAQWVVKRMGWKNSFKFVRFIARKKFEGRLKKKVNFFSK
jgi:hypothetical protein